MSIQLRLRIDNHGGSIYMLVQGGVLLGGGYKYEKEEEA